MAGQPIRVLLVDDDPRFLDALSAMLERIPNVEVAGQAANGDEALRRTAELLPDVITTDIDMPVVDGVEATRLIVHYFKTPVVILAGSESGGRIDDALAARAVAHIPKSRAWDELVPLRNLARRVVLLRRFGGRGLWGKASEGECSGEAGCRDVGVAGLRLFTAAHTKTLIS